LIALHKPNVTLSNYLDVALFIKMENHSVSTQTTQQQQSDSFRIEGCTCTHDGRDTIRHNKCRYCHFICCPSATGQDWCPNPDCSNGLKGCKFQPNDEHHEWVKCKCGMWFKTQEILNAHAENNIICKET
jgi:hypothetical protein